MLETIKKELNNSPCITFEEYFLSYVFTIQDKILDNEISFLLRNNLVDVNFLCKELGMEFSRL